MNSGIELIENLYERTAMLNRRLDNIEHLLKEVLDRLNRASVKESSSVAQTGKLRFNNHPADLATPESGQPKTPSIQGTVSHPQLRPASNARIIGRIKDGSGKGLPEVAVTIHDSKNHVVKKTRTNRAGDWMAFLPPGKYAAECVLEGKVNGNVVFTVGQRDRTVSVGQPQ